MHELSARAAAAFELGRQGGQQMLQHIDAAAQASIQRAKAHRAQAGGLQPQAAARLKANRLQRRAQLTAAAEHKRQSRTEALLPTDRKSVV